MRGWSILAGAIAGVLLGPTLFGRVAPGRYERWFLGGAAERIERDRVIRMHNADLIAAASAESNEAETERLQRAFELELVKVTQHWRDAQWKHQAPLRAITLFVVACALLYGGPHSIARANGRSQFLAPFTIGVWAAALPGGITYAAMVGLFGFSTAQAAATAAIVSVGPWFLTPLDQKAADDAEVGGARMIQSAGRVASIVAILIAAAALWFQRGIEGLLMCVPLLGLPAGWLLHARGHGLKSIIQFVAIPALTAAITIKIELFEDFAIWPLALLIIIIDDGRWLGALCGAMLLGGRHTLRTMRLVVGIMSAAVTQLAMLALAVHAWAVPMTIVLPVILGSLLIEMTYEMRRKLVQRLATAEDEFSDQLEP